MKRNKLFLLFPILLFAMSACEKQAHWSGADRNLIGFSSPYISAEQITTRSVFHEEYLPEGATFGVMGYCVPYLRGTTEPDWAAGANSWNNNNLTNVHADVFYNQKLTCTGNVCTYDYQNTAGTGPRRWYNTQDWPEAANAENYRYTFFAWYPYDGFRNGFQLEYPTSASAAGAPRLTFTMPYIGNGKGQPLDDNITPDAMLAVSYNHLKSLGNIDLNFNHILVGLGFAVTNYHETADITVNSITLSGEFVRSVTVDFNRTTDDPDFFSYRGTYSGTYTIFSGERTIDSGERVSPIGGKHLLLLSDPEGTYFGPNTTLTVNYSYNGEKRRFSTGRPGSFHPVPGTKYTTNLNFIGNSFVIDFEAENQWENGNQNDDEEIVIQ